MTAGRTKTTEYHIWPATKRRPPLLRPGRPPPVRQRRATTAAEITNEERRTWAGIAGGLGGALGLVIALQRLQVARDDRITDRHIRAIEQLGTRRDDGEPNVEVRIGAIFALERIARDSDRDHWPIMQTLSAYVRENAPVLEDSDWVQDNPRIDVQTILTVLGRRHRRSEETNNQWLDLRTTDLRRAHLQDARLHGADLGGRTWNAQTFPLPPASPNSRSTSRFATTTPSSPTALCEPGNCPRQRLMSTQTRVIGHIFRKAEMSTYTVRACRWR